LCVGAMGAEIVN